MVTLSQNIINLFEKQYSCEHQLATLAHNQAGAATAGARFERARMTLVHSLHLR